MVKKAKAEDLVLAEMKKKRKPATQKVQRGDDTPKIPEDERKMVAQWTTEIRADRNYFSKKFDQMRKNMEYVRLGADKKWVDADNYTVPIIGRFVNQAVAALYAKNPQAQAKRKPKLLYQNWDGTQEEAQAALALVQGASQPPQPGQPPAQTDPAALQNAQDVLKDVQTAQAYDKQMKRMGRTLEILFEYYTGTDFPDFKKRMKAMVRRAKTTNCGYVEVSFHRATEPDPDVVDRIGDMQQELMLIQSRKADLTDKIYGEDDTRAIELRSMIETLEEEKFRVIDEGLVFDFPQSTSIIPHRACTQLSGFIGADYVTREYAMTTEEIQATFKKDVSKSYKVYVNTAGKGASSETSTAGSDKEGDSTSEDYKEDNYREATDGKKTTNGKAIVWRIQSKKTRQEFWICDGYPGYLRAPAAPDNQVMGFWTIFSLIVNELEDEKEIYHPADVEYLMHPQREYNNARQGMREHRRANRPKYFAKRGVLEDKDKALIESAPAHAVIEIGGIEPGMNIDQLIQPYKGVPLDPNMYETSSIIKDVLYGVGAQQADLGNTGDSTATESSIAEQSRMSTLASNVDDLDELLSEVARCSSQVMLQQLNQQTVIEIVGPGALWPTLTTDQIVKELYLEIRAGSSGRPNQAAELAALERAMQYLIQLGHINPAVLAKKYCDLLNLDEDEFIVEGMPSILSLNAAAQAHSQALGQIATNNASAAVNGAHGSVPQPGAPGANGARPAQPKLGAPGQPQMPHGNPSQNPGSQGPAGAGNGPQAPGVAPGPQPAYPAPTQHVQ